MITIGARICSPTNALRLVIVLAFVYFVLHSQQLNIFSLRSFSGPRGVIVSLIRSDNRSIKLVINMIHSINRFYLPNETKSYPIVIFHDQNLTLTMRKQILSCVLNKIKKKQLQISFALVDFHTSIKPRVDQFEKTKPIGYRLMCRFWSRDVFFHPTIVQGGYDYLMRLDDDSYFSRPIYEDLFAYMARQKLDYIYRGWYHETLPALFSVEKLFLKDKTQARSLCFYNNFFAIRLEWFYKSEQVQKFLRELVRNDRMLREYIGDGCVHAAWQEIDNKSKIEHIQHISYGHNYHVMAESVNHFAFTYLKEFYDEIEKSCQQLTVIDGPNQHLRCGVYIGLLFVFLLLCLVIFQPRQSSISTPRIDWFFSNTLCGRLIRYVDLLPHEVQQLTNESSSSLSSLTFASCALFYRPITVSPDEREFPLAYTILIYSNLDQFDLLLRAIYREHNYYCVHVDSKAPSSLYAAIERRSRCVSNIFVIKKRFNVTWGQFSVLEAERACQRELLEQSNNWKYYFNLANSDFPLKTNAEIVKILKLYRGQNDVTSLFYPSRARQKRVHNDIQSNSVSWQFYKGEFHVTLSRWTVEFLHSDKKVAELYAYLDGTIVPDEHFYSIINRWPETPGYFPYDWDLSQVTFMTRYKLWGDRPEHHLCRGGFVRGICVFNYQDLWHLATSPHLFANKVFLERDRITSYCLAQYLHVRDLTRKENDELMMIDEQFYRQLAPVQFANTYD